MSFSTKLKKSQFPLLCDGNWLYFCNAVLRLIRYARQPEKAKGKEKANQTDTSSPTTCQVRRRKQAF